MLQILQKKLHPNKINETFLFISIFLKQQYPKLTTTVNNIQEGTTIIVGRQNIFLRKISVNLPLELFPSNSVFSYNSTRHFASGFSDPILAKKKKMGKLNEKERSEQLPPLLNAGWTMVQDRDAIYKEYLFKNFNEAFSFMTSIAMLAEKLDHHPEWFNVYNKVQITMSTHDVGGLSAKDIKVANFMEQQAKKLL